MSPSGFNWGEGDDRGPTPEVQALEHELERKERLLAIEQAAHSKLEVEVAQKEYLANNLLEAQRKKSASPW